MGWGQLTMVLAAGVPAGGGDAHRQRAAAGRLDGRRQLACPGRLSGEPGPAAADHAARPRVSAHHEPGGDVHCIPEDVELARDAPAHVARDHRPSIDADHEAERHVEARVVLTQLVAHLDGGRYEADMRSIADSSSDTERRAAEAERELVEWKKVKFMIDKVGDEFAALIISTTRFGFFV